MLRDVGRSLRRAPRPRTMRRIAWAALLAQVGIVISGNAVRLTKSGLGCPTWPRCSNDTFIPNGLANEHPTLNQAIEFGNRLLTFVVLAVAIAALVAARRTRRPDLTRLALLQPLGVVAQVLLGGVTVLVDLHPAAVAAHFLLSMAIIAAAVALVERTGSVPGQPAERQAFLLGRALVPVAALVLVAGTVVTGAGPHAGDADSPRFDVSVPAVAQLHAGVVYLLVALTFGLLLTVRITSAPTRLVRLVTALFAVELAQGVLGYVQYLTDVPALLVAAHVSGACLVWVLVLRVTFAVRRSEQDGVERDGEEDHGEIADREVEQPHRLQPAP